MAQPLGSNAMYGGAATSPRTASTPQPPSKKVASNVSPYSQEWEDLMFAATEEDLSREMDRQQSRRGVWSSGQSSSQSAKALEKLRAEIALAGASGRQTAAENEANRQTSSSNMDKQISAQEDMAKSQMWQQLLATALGLGGSFALNKAFPNKVNQFVPYQGGIYRVQDDDTLKLLKVAGGGSGGSQDPFEGAFQNLERFKLGATLAPQINIPTANSFNPYQSGFGGQMGNIGSFYDLLDQLGKMQGNSGTGFGFGSTIGGGTPGSKLNLNWR